MNIQKVKMLDLSDIHLGHNKTTTEEIVDHLYQFFQKYDKVLYDIDILMISGDIFDRLLPNNSKEYQLAVEWLSNVAKYCKTNNIKLRILEGTPSHDFKQLKTFNTVLTKLNIEVDFKYFDKIHIEYMEDLGIHILYIPDEINETAEETWEEVQSLLHSLELTQVDFTIIHGQFHYHLPMFTSPVSHRESDYLSITKHYVVCGHIHNHSAYDRILTPGSFDRLTHNEEEKKGGLLIYVNGAVREYLFLENTLAKVYKTLHYQNITIEELMKDIRSLKLPPKSRLRIRVKAGSELKKSVDILRNTFKQYHIDIEYTDKKEEKEQKVLFLEKQEAFSITKDNLIPLMKEEIGRDMLNHSDWKILEDTLQKIL